MAVSDNAIYLVKMRWTKIVNAKSEQDQVHCLQIARLAYFILGQPSFVKVFQLTSTTIIPCVDASNSLIFKYGGESMECVFVLSSLPSFSTKLHTVLD